MLRKIKYSINLILLVIIASAFVKADIYFDSKGKDFWLTFLPNFHNYRFDTDPIRRLGDSLYIFISSEGPTSGNIEYYNAAGVRYNASFTITDPKVIHTFKVCYDNFELLGYNDSGDNWAPNQCESVAQQSFHVTSNDDITVYALDQAVTTSEAFLVLPTDVLGKDYFVLCYNSDGIYVSSTSSSRTPSQFAIVASEDNTDVTITPKTDTYINRSVIQNVSLNKGEVYLVQARFTMGNNYPDLSGSVVKATKPIALFAGHQRSTLPINTFTGTPSRDCLIEQMPPLSTWGKNAFLVPYQQPPVITRIGNDKYRILAAYDSTHVYINGVKTVTINKGGFYEGNLDRPAKVTATNPILVAQYKKTSGESGFNNNELGDPFMMIIPPSEQFLNSYRVINAQAFEENLPVYIEQYIGIVSPDTAMNSVFIDGVKINQATFTSIPNSGYSYTNVRVQDGVHEVKASAGIGIFVYGYGHANSYGYTGGMSYKPIDLSPPQITGIDSCYIINGIVYDSAMVRNRLKSVTAPRDSIDNTTIWIDSIVSGRPTVKFSGSLINRYRDGKFTIEAEDSSFKTASKTFLVPGFTVGLNQVGEKDSIVVFKNYVRRNNEYCFSVFINNYGKFQQHISKLGLKKNQEFYLKDSLPPNMLPGETDTVQICFKSTTDSIYKDTLYVEGICGNRTLLALSIEVTFDKNPPEIARDNGICDTVFNVVVSDSLPSDYGLARIEIIDTINCRITQKSSLYNLVNLEVTVTDPYKDAIYRISAEDSAGFKKEKADTIQGFTILMSGFGNLQYRIDFGKHPIGTLVCESFDIFNYGILPFDLSKMFLSKNILFSLPQAEFPMLLQPNEKRLIEICYRPVKASNSLDYDTLNLIFSCLSQSVILSGSGDPLIRESITKCNVPVKLTVNSIPFNYILEPVYPNPVINEGKIVFGVPEKDYASVTISDIYGIKTEVLFKGDIQPGIYKIEFNAGDFTPGIYFYTLDTKNTRLSRFFVISD